MSFATSSRQDGRPAPRNETEPNLSSLGVVWFRQDLRLTDHRPLCAAIARHARLVFVYVHDARHDQEARIDRGLGFVRMGAARRQWLAQGLLDLGAQLASHGHALWVTAGDSSAQLSTLMSELGASMLYCEEIAAPEEQAELGALQELGGAKGFGVESFWQSSGLEIEDLPFEIQELPPVFSRFRREIERAGQKPRAPLDPPGQLPAPPPELPGLIERLGWRLCGREAIESLLALDPLEQVIDPRGSLSIAQAGGGAERAALRHLSAYFESDLPQHYKETRNQLVGLDFSTKFSPWLSIGALSARTIWRALASHEERFGANDSTYWIGFELWWRDYFRFLHHQHGRRLYRFRGLSAKPSRSVAPPFIPERFSRWRQGQTGVDFIDAGMQELNATGYLSNRLRQNVASYWINDLEGDWRVGAAWFEHCLIDYDVYSNHGNWLYLAGRGTDPRDGRRFDPHKQARVYDPQGTYRRLWLG